MLMIMGMRLGVSLFVHNTSLKGGAKASPFSTILYKLQQDESCT